MSLSCHVSMMEYGWVFVLLCLFLRPESSDASVIRNTPNIPLKRTIRSLQEPGKIGCIHMESFPGEYWFESVGGSTVCGFYIIGLSNQLIELEFQDFDISCDNGGLMALLDGWETQGQIFPSDEDHLLSMDERYTLHCGQQRPRGIITTSQNVALLQYRVPQAGQGFRVVVRFIDNPQPCNVVSLEADGEYTLKNYGHRKNCSVSFLYPESFRILSMDVGHIGLSKKTNGHGGLMAKCASRALTNYVQFLGGVGLDSSIMPQALDVCGADSRPDFPPVNIECSHSVVRLVSTEHFYNSITFSFRVLLDSTRERNVFTKCYQD